MAERNLPIKFFQKRQKDELSTEGGGGGDPIWLLSGRPLYQRSSYIQTVLENVGTRIADKVKRNNYLPTIITVKLDGEATAKSHRDKITGIFNAGKVNTIGFAGDDEILVKIDSMEDVRAINRNLEKAQTAFPPKTTAIGVSAIINVEEYTPVIEVSEPGEAVLKVKMFHYGNDTLDATLLKSFEEYCKQRRLSYKRTSYTDDLIVYKVEGANAAVLDELKDLDGIISVTDMPYIDVASDIMDFDDSIEIKQPTAGVSYPLIGVLDTGIARVNHLTPWLEQDNITYYQEEDLNKSHGTFVAGVIIYGDQMEKEAMTGLDGCRVFEAIVLPDLDKQEVSESELIEQIRDTITRHEKIKIWNLSLGSKQEADLIEFSDFAKVLDDLQEKYNVLICKSAGNCKQYQTRAPKQRITRSADSVRSLVVGSIGHDKQPSSFSRLGPGPSYLIKPDVVHIGGAASLDTRGNEVRIPVKSLAADGGLKESIGTSFSTPRIAAIAAGLDSLLSEPFNPTLIKALIIHSARYPQEMKMSLKEKINSTGFGLPRSIPEIVFNEPNEITLILQDTIEKGSFIDILDFPFPQSMTDEQGYYYGEVTVTLVTAPVLDASQGGEYCQSNIDVYFGSYDEKKDRDTTQPGIKNAVGADGRKNLLHPSLYSASSKRDTDQPFATERMLVTYGDKYQPVKKWSVNFDEFTPANKDKFLQAPKYWYLKLEGLFRHYTEVRCEAEKTVPSQEFCLIITIRDTKKRGNIYNEATQLLNRFGFIHSNVKVNEEVRIRLSGNG